MTGATTTGVISPNDVPLSAGEDVAVRCAKPIFDTLNGARGVAAFCVVLFHAGFYIQTVGLERGYLAVDLFFVLSGFVLGQAYEPRFRSGLSPARFMAMRLARLYPLYILGTLIGLASAVVAWAMGANSSTAGQLVTAAVSALFMAPDVGRSHPNIYPLNNPAWSLLFELSANLVYVLFWPLLSNRVLMAVVAVCGLVMGYNVLAHDTLWAAGVTWQDLWWGFPRVGFSFFAGVLIFRYWRGSQVQRPWAWCLPLLMLPLFAWPMHSPLGGVVDLAVVVLVIPALVTLMATCRPGLKLTVLYTFLAEASYAVYALHFPLIEMAARAMKVVHIDAAGVHSMFGVLFTAGLFAAGWVLDQIYDQPFRKMLNRLIPTP